VTLSIVGDEVHLLEGVLPAPGEPLTSFGDSPVSSGSSYGGSQDDAEAEREAAAAAAASAWAAAAAAGPVWDGERWVLPAGHFAPGAVGAKAMSVARLAAATEGGPNGVRLPAWLSVPPAVALPHGAFEAALQAPLNRDLAGQLAAQLDGLVAEVDASGGACVPAGKLEYVRGLVSSLRVPPGLQHELRSALAPLAEAAGGSGYNWDGVWEAIKGVWASQWNERAVTALAKARLPLGELRMGVLLQPLLPARYSWCVR
jgi:alpha-glucan,water dikinase